MNARRCATPNRRDVFGATRDDRVLREITAAADEIDEIASYVSTLPRRIARSGAIRRLLLRSRVAARAPFAACAVVRV